MGGATFFPPQVLSQSSQIAELDELFPEAFVVLLLFVLLLFVRSL